MNETQQNGRSTKIQFNYIGLITKIRDMRRQIYEDPHRIRTSNIDEIESSIRRIMLQLCSLHEFHECDEGVEDMHGTYDADFIGEFDDFMVRLLMRVHHRRLEKLQELEIGVDAASGDNDGNDASGGYRSHVQPQPSTYEQLSTEAIDLIATDLNDRCTSSANDVIYNMIKMIALRRNTDQ